MQKVANSEKYISLYFSPYSSYINSLKSIFIPLSFIHCFVTHLYITHLIGVYAIFCHSISFLKNKIAIKHTSGRYGCNSNTNMECCFVRNATVGVCRVIVIYNKYCSLKKLVAAGYCTSHDLPKWKPKLRIIAMG